MIKNRLKASLIIHTRQLKEDNGKLKQNAERYGVREGSPVKVQWAVWWLDRSPVRSVLVVREITLIPVDSTRLRIFMYHLKIHYFHLTTSTS